jgi:radical SAM protein with 4Fe4S-binding SPASM domain
MLKYGHWKHGRDYQVLDLAAGCPVLFLSGNHRLFRVDPETGTRLRQGLRHLTEEEGREWELLADAKVISDVNTRRLAQAGATDGAALAINVNLTSICNLNCTYCFADGGDYGRIKGKLGEATVGSIFRFIRSHIREGQAVRFEFFGGEPLLNLERILDICRLSERVALEDGIRFIYRLSTNLTVLPPEALDLLVRRDFIVSVSIDGGHVTHNRNRPGKDGGGSFDRILANCTRVRDAGPALVLVARMTVVGDCPPLVDNVRELWGYNLFDYFQIYPGVVPREKANVISLKVLGDADLTVAPPTISPRFLPQFLELVRIYPDLFQPGNRFKGVLEFERAADMIIRGKLALSFCSGGRNYYTFSPDDSIMPCHRLVGDVRFQVGEATRGLTVDPVAWRMPVDCHPVCSECWIRYACGGGCKQENLVGTGDIHTPNPEACHYQIKMVESVIQIIAEQGKAYGDRRRDVLDDLFVSCGRPVILSQRDEEFDLAGAQLRYFRPL